MNPVLLHSVAKRLCVVSNATVSGHNCDELGRFAEQLRSRKVHRIQRAYRFHRKRPPNAREDRLGYSHDGATTLEYLKPSYCGALLVGRNTAARAGTYDRASCFCGSDRRGHKPAASA